VTVSARPDCALALLRAVGSGVCAIGDHRVGSLTADEMWAVDDALVTVLGLD
jgi:hypothetical protein